MTFFFVLLILYFTYINTCSFYHLFFQAIKKDDYPTDFRVFMDKEILFKIEISVGNINRRFMTYAVKKATDDGDAIKQFKTKHNIKVKLATICA